MLFGFLKIVNMKYILFIFAIATSQSLNSQILNVDRENGQDTIARKHLFSWNSSFAIDKQQNNLIELANAIEYDNFFKNDLVWIVFLNSEASLNGQTILENNGYFQTRLRDNDKKRVAPDYYVQYQWNSVWGLQNRALAGCNARFKFWDDKTDDLFISAGAFYEYEKWNTTTPGYGFQSSSDTIVFRAIPRLNFGAKTAFKVAKGIDFAAKSFLQFPMNDAFDHFNNPRWSLHCNLNFEINKHLSMALQYDQNIDYFRPLPIDVFFYNLNVGFQVRW